MDYLIGGMVGFAIGVAAQRVIGELVRTRWEKQLQAWKK